MERQSGLPEDRCINTWHCKSSHADVGQDAEDFSLALIGFYNTIDGAYSDILTGDVTLPIYDLSDPRPRVPIATYTPSMVTDTSPALPAEVSVVLSYRGQNVSGTNPARRRGRIFLGPFSTDVLSDTDNDATVNTAFISSLTGAASSLVGAGTPTMNWCVFSPTSAGAEPWSEAELDASSVPVVGGFVDNAFDTVRSRGARATDRELWTGILP